MYKLVTLFKTLLNIDIHCTPQKSKLSKNTSHTTSSKNTSHTTSKNLSHTNSSSNLIIY